MSYIKKSLDIVVFGGGGFIGSAILREAAKRSLSIIPVGKMYQRLSQVAVQLCW